MSTHKKFFMYLVWVILFFLFSKLMIYVALNSTYSYKDIIVKSNLVKEAKVQTNAVTGVANIIIKNNSSSSINDQYIEIKCYSKNDVLMGTKYVKLENITTNEEKEFEIRFNYNKVEKVQIDVIDELPAETKEEQKISDKKLTFVAVTAAIIAMMVIW